MDLLTSRRFTVLGLALGVLAGSANAASPAAAGAAACDRQCLLNLADSYLAALVAHDATKLPLAGDVKRVENAKRTQAGEGLWKTASAGPTEFKVVVPDAVAQQVAGIVMMQSEGKPVQLGFRLKLVNGRVTETEHLLATPREPFLTTNLQKLRPAIAMTVPDEYADSRGRLLHIAKSYYDALDNNNGHLSPFAPDCERHENGMRTAPSGGPSLAGAAIPGQAPRAPTLLGMQDCTSQLDAQVMSYITTIDNRRVEIADEKLGLAVGFSHFRHPMTQKEYQIVGDPARTTSTSNFNPFDLPAMHIFKIWGGQIHEIEAMGFQAPLNSPSGWE